MKYKFFSILGIILVFYLVYYFINTTIKNNTPLTIESLTRNEALANSIYKNKKVIVEGVVDKISFLNDRNTIFLKTKGLKSNILCDMGNDQLDQINQLEKGQKIIVKGSCKGFLGNIILLDCILIKTNINE